MTQRFLAAFVCLCSPLALAQGAAPNTPRPGILLLAHGGRVQTWNEEVRHVADQVDLKVPTEVAFGMATRSSMQDGIDRLVARGVTEVIAVPLFVSSHSSVIDSTAYLFGLRPTAPEDLKMFASMDHGAGGMKMDHGSMDHGAGDDKATKPVHATVPVHMAPALDHHDLVADILLDRAASISSNPSNEVVVLVAHGPVPADENAMWLADMKILGDKMQIKAHYSGVVGLTVRDDAGDEIRNQATKELRAQVEKITASGKTALVVPLLLSYGGIENGLRDRLKGLSYKMPTQGLLPDARIVSWVLASEAATTQSSK